MKKNILLVIFFVLYKQYSFAQVDDVKNFLKANPQPKGFYSSLVKAKANKEHVLHLNLQGLDLKEIPLELLEFSNLIDLDLSNNDIQEIPKWIVKLKKLKKLSLRKNKIKYLPGFIFEIPLIEILDLWGNNITTFSVNNLGVMCKIREIDLSQNKITELPGDIKKLICLKILKLESNKISKLSCAMLNMKDVEYVYLFNNLIDSIEDCTLINNKLKALYLNSNPISKSTLKKIKERLPNCDVSIL